MDIILNDLSLSGQFKSIDQFEANLTESIIPLLKHFTDAQCTIYKNINSFNNNVTKDKTLATLFYMRGSPQLQRAKSLLSNLLYEDPYWDNDGQDGSNCIHQASNKNGILLSFMHDDFLDDYVTIDSNSIKVMNSFNSTSGLTHLFENNVINENCYYSSLHMSVLIHFFAIDNMNYTQSFFDKYNFTSADKIHIKNDIFNIIACISTKSSFTKTVKYMEDSIYELRCSISDSRALRIFFAINNNIIIFFNGFLKTSKKTPKNELEQAKKLVALYHKQCNL